MNFVTENRITVTQTMMLNDCVFFSLFKDLRCDKKPFETHKLPQFSIEQ